MRRLSFLALLAVPGFALADDLLVARSLMSGAMAEIASYDRVTFDLAGTEEDGNKVHSFRAVVAVGFLPVGERLVPHMEVLDYRDNALQDRFAADGLRFWHYDIGSKTYTSSDYGTSGFVGQERERLFQTMLLRSRGSATFLAKLMKDTYGSGMNAASSWLPWRPNSSVAVSGTNIVCTANVPAASRLTYYLEPNVGFGYALTGAEYIEKSTISGRDRVTRWQVTIRRNFLPNGTSYQFVPPAGSRAVAVSEARGGGL